MFTNEKLEIAKKSVESAQKALNDIVEVSEQEARDREQVARDRELEELRKFKKEHDDRMIAVQATISPVQSSSGPIFATHRVGGSSGSGVQSTSSTGATQSRVSGALLASKPKTGPAVVDPRQREVMTGLSKFPKTTLQ